MSKKLVVIAGVLICMLMILTGCGEEKKVAGGKEVVDMTNMSGNVIYGEVFAMMNEPQKYMGKTIRIKGIFNTQVDSNTGKEYFFLLITDAQACCKQGIELKGKGDAPPRGLPSKGGEMTVEGKFGKYEEGGKEYYCIFVEKITAPPE